MKNEDTLTDIKILIKEGMTVILAFLKEFGPEWPTSGIAVISGVKRRVNGVELDAMELFEPSDGDGSHLSISKLKNIKCLKYKYPEAEIINV